jgi:hypothetical protein
MILMKKKPAGKKGLLSAGQLGFGTLPTNRAGSAVLLSSGSVLGQETASSEGVPSGDSPRRIARFCLYTS